MNDNIERANQLIDSDNQAAADYLREAEQRARKFQGAWTGTSGALAADVMNLLAAVKHVRGWPRYLSTPEPATAPAPAPAEGTTAKFGTGAVRSDTVESFRYDLVSPIGLREVARACAEGAEKYDDFNWEKGMPVHDLLNHAIAHIYQFLAGDRSEPHLGHAAWNLLAAIHSHELWPHLNEGMLRGANCRPPTTLTPTAG